MAQKSSSIYIICKIYSLGLVILMAGAGRVAVAQSDPWMRTGRALLRSLM